MDKKDNSDAKASDKEPMTAEEISYDGDLRRLQEVKLFTSKRLFNEEWNSQVWTHYHHSDSEDDGSKHLSHE